MRRLWWGGACHCRLAESVHLSLAGSVAAHVLGYPQPFPHLPPRCPPAPAQGWDVLLRAFLTAFTAQDNVLLLLHTKPFHSEPNFPEQMQVRPACCGRRAGGVGVVGWPTPRWPCQGLHCMPMAWHACCGFTGHASLAPPAPRSPAPLHTRLRRPGRASSWGRRWWRTCSACPLFTC